MINISGRPCWMSNIQADGNIGRPISGNISFNYAMQSPFSPTPKDLFSIMHKGTSLLYLKRTN
jgi:hypothetical protein